MAASDKLEQHFRVDDFDNELSTKNLQSAHGLVEAAHLYREDSNGKVTGKYLIPRPTADPKDPLTWSVWRKHLAMASTCLFVFLSNYITATISPILVPIIISFEISVTKATYLITCNILFLGLGNLFWIPLAQKIGKRPVLIACSAIFFGSTIWSAKAESWGSLLAARIIQGFGASASEALGVAIVADLYFLHERGTKVGFYTLMIAGGSSIGGIFAGLIGRATTDWRWVFWMNTILTGVCFVFILLFQAETNFARTLLSESGEDMEEAEFAELRSRTRGSFVTAMSVIGWYDKSNSIWRLWWRPLLMLQYPAVLWGSITYGITLGWVVLQQTANATAFPEIYGFSEFGVGNLNIASLIGAIVGCFFGGPGSDWVVHYITKRRRGYFEPEYRLWCLIPSVILGPIGLLLWGCGLQNHLNPYVAIAGTGITYGVLCAVPATGMTYVVDCYKPVSGETITVLTAFKNTFAFAVSFAVTPWIVESGFAAVSGYATLIEVVIFATTIPMYIYGKRLRRWTAKIET